MTLEFKNPRKALGYGILALMAFSLNLISPVQAQTVVTPDRIEAPGVLITNDRIEAPGVLITKDGIRTPNMVVTPNGIETKGSATGPVPETANSAPNPSVSRTAQPMGKEPLSYPPQSVSQQLSPVNVGSYTNSELSGMNFSGQYLVEASFVNATLDGASFVGSNLSRARFTNADLRGADLRGARLVGAVLSNANLSQALLAGADLTGADLTNADLSGADLRQAILVNARLNNVNLKGALLEGSNRQSWRSEDTKVVADSTTIVTALTRPPVAGAPARIDLSVNFDFNSDRLNVDSRRQVAEMAKALLDPKLASMKILIEGHTDDVGSDAYNLGLSKRRAHSVLYELARAYGVDPERLSVDGKGESEPVASNASEYGRAMNRRVSLVVLGSVR